MENSQVKKSRGFLEGLRALDVIDVMLCRLDWPRMWPVKIPVWEHEIALTANNGSVAIGRGSDASYQISILKALSESIERRQTQRSGSFSSSNGWAAHTEIEAAVLQAKWEVIERDLYLCHVLTETPFQEMSLEHESVSEWIRELAKYLQSEYGIEILVGSMGEHSAFSAVSVAVFGADHFGVITSQAVSDSFAGSVEKAFVHCLRNVSHELSGDSQAEPLSLSAFRSLNRVNPRHHYLLGLHPDSVPFIRRLYAKRKAIFSLDRLIDFESIRWIDMTPEALPRFKVVKATADSLQQMFFGCVEKGQVNMRRLRDFTERANLQFDSLNRFPHTHH